MLLFAKELGAIDALVNQHKPFKQEKYDEYYY